MQTQPNRTKPADRPTPHRTAPKPQRKRSTALPAPLSPDAAEGLLLRIASGLGRGQPGARDAHHHFMAGAVAFATVIGLFDAERAGRIETAIDVLLAAGGTAAKCEPAPAAPAPASATPAAAASGEDAHRGGGDGDDPLYAAAVRIVRRTLNTGIAHLQRQLPCGYNRAARLLERMEREGIVSAPDMFGARVLIVGVDQGGHHDA